MRLSRLKLAGFKSFVDPTEIRLPSALVGIIGPNGCGKSNTIDAVRWVMGESSAKHLRGESMDDVIFTGSSTRKPVSQASVELIFDNSDGSLGGEYAAYAEISLKREVNREGVSKYSLNHSRCRRRDIRDIFLGTGLGPRSYAIIEQGMVARLIEARPEDLRVYVEEAAGISKYKERRRETENRMRHTQENLERLDDLREEVNKQIAHLKRQADTAERYRHWKGEERRLRGELLVLRRRELGVRREAQVALERTQEVELEGIVADLRAAESAIEQSRLQHDDAQSAFGRIQAEVFRLGAEVSRTEQQIDFAQQTRRRREGELAETRDALAQARQHATEDRDRIDAIDLALADDQPAFSQLERARQLSAEQLVATERALDAWRERDRQHRERESVAMRDAQVERSRTEQLDRSLAQLEERFVRASEERAGLDTATASAEIEAAIAREVQAVDDETRLQQQLARCLADRDGQREVVRVAQSGLASLQGELQTLNGRRAGLVALQQAALDTHHARAEAWLAEAGLEDSARLAQALVIEPGWEVAVETVLHGWLDAVCADDRGATTWHARPPDASLALLDGAPSLAALDTAADSLLARVQGPPALADLFVGVRTAATLEAAFAMRTTLADGESVVTPDGHWLGRRWLRRQGEVASDGVLKREREIAESKAVAIDLEARVADIERSLAESGERLDELERRRETVQHALNDAVRALADVRATLQTSRSQLQQIDSRGQRIDDELEEMRRVRERDQSERAAAESRRLEALRVLEQLAEAGATLAGERDGLVQAFETARANAETDRGAEQALAIRVQSLTSTRAATAQNLERTTARIDTLAARLAALEAASPDDADSEITALKDALRNLLTSRLTAEQALGSAREQLESLQTRLRGHEQDRVRHDNRAASVRDALQAARLEAQEVVVRLATLDEQLAEHGYEIDAIAPTLPEHATVDVWTSELEQIERRIARLGPINLAAIDEHAEQLERKSFLDAQHDDVTTALATLEQAIGRIDHETRERFRDTYDRVNAKFSEFFPRLFGGGLAALELTEQDLLTTGITVVARPPGKRVSSIQLLSGGEKALTAVALVFAFFELNPSPFCMLDEVDAPLDDANVGRFCSLVKEMSERVQFIFITHNKVTMEMADQLMGVTMNEPGVSRLVAVDVREAVELASA